MFWSHVRVVALACDALLLRSLPHSTCPTPPHQFSHAIITLAAFHSPNLLKSSILLTNLVDMFKKWVLEPYFLFFIYWSCCWYIFEWVDVLHLLLSLALNSFFFVYFLSLWMIWSLPHLWCELYCEWVEVLDCHLFATLIQGLTAGKNHVIEWLIFHTCYFWVA